MENEKNEKQVYREIRAVKSLIRFAEEEQVRQEKLQNSEQAMYQAGKKEGLEIALSALREVATVD